MQINLKQQELLQALPKVDDFLDKLTSLSIELPPQRLLKKCVQTILERERKAILAAKDITPLPRTMEQWLALATDEINIIRQPRLKRIFNGTGVIIHTNLGRSVLPKSCLTQLTQAGGNYSNLEFNLATGKRGSRYALIEEFLCDLTGAEAALVVNNNAAAVLISLDTLAKGKEVIVSRGQLVEIGGSFRIPDVMAKSGAKLIEVGATNRTHLHDYKQAITEKTSMLLRVHTSNFRIVGFTSEVSAEEMTTLAQEENLITMEDLGSGSLIDLSQYGFPYEPSVQEIVRAGVDVITFSGDKLLGGPQAGIIVGKKDIIGQIKKNPLNRALRIDKFTLAALESLLREYYNHKTVLRKIPTLRMLTEPVEVVRKRAERLHSQLLSTTCETLKKTTNSGLTDKRKITLEQTIARVGGGALPEHNIPSWGLFFSLPSLTPTKMEQSLRTLPQPIIGRIEQERFLLDMRTIKDDEVDELATILLNFFDTL